MRSTMTAPGDKAITSVGIGNFRSGARLGTSNPKDLGDVPRHTESYQGSTRQPIYRGTRYKMWNPQGVPNIERGAEMAHGV